MNDEREDEISRRIKESNEDDHVRRKFNDDDNEDK
jgi:hypothetical protein